ncbi:ComEC/Rec2 family competence protein [Agromyces marinus]|uniref:Membrane protein n=1 Tax=Agromyces marinus TaxID=1389020 RepID=A0ABN6Y7D5_9MICO|nr:ComEC/Rec2 family competence protein [Agromyces marinus]UIP58465.1 hypothetical protein DSM26151_13400 [Agromyces marinus]BDZ53272.1 membrane protein [Agromyces marinus]
MRGHDLRLLAPAGAAWAAGWWATGATEAGVPTWVVPAAAWSTALVAVAILVRGRSVVRGAAAVLLTVASAAGLVAGSAWVVLEQRHPLSVATAADSRAPVLVHVRLDASPRPARAAPWDEGGRLRAAGTLIALEAPDGTLRTLGGVPVRVSLSMPEIDPAPGYGSTVVARARLSPEPGSSRAAYRAATDEVAAVEAASPFVAWTHPLRASFADAAAGLGGDGGALVPGLAIGDTSRVSEELEAAMTTASLTHLTAVSGANCAIVTAAAFWFAGLAGASRLGRVVAALVALGAFVALVTPEASVVRASAMAVVVLVACATARAAGGVPALSAAVIVLLAIDPWYARDAGFALSVCATAGLVLLAGPLTGVLARWMPRTLAAVVAIPAAAQIACQPVLILLEPVIALYGVPANLLAAPAAPIATIAGLLGCLLLPVLPSVAVALMQVAWVPASWIAMLARGVETLPVPGVAWPEGALGAGLVIVAAASWVVLAFGSTGTAGRSVDRGRAGPRPIVRAVAATLLLTCTAVPLGAAAGPAFVAAASRPGDWDVWQCDVGQGDAVLVRVDGSVMLIDTGPEASALDRCLSTAGVDRVDLLVITHWDADHAGGTGALGGRVGTVLHGPLDGARSDRALEPLVAAGAGTVEVVAGRTGTLGGAQWRVVWPRPGAAPGNDASVVLALASPEFRAVFLGDLGRDAQDALRRAGTLERADIVKVAHHGSADQSAELTRSLDPRVGLIGVGADNGYGHPTDAALDALAATGATAVRSDLAGHAALRVEDDGIRLWTERGADVAAPP